MKLYHVSYKHLGQAVTLVPRVPENRAPNEDDHVKRICVSSRVGDCLRMFPWADGQHKVHVYVTEVKNVPRPSWALPKKYVPDYKKWGREEIWLLNKKGYEFKWFGYVRMFRVEMMFGTAFWYFKRGGEGYGEYFADPTRIFTESCWKQYAKTETWRKMQSRKFIREVPIDKPWLEYANDIKKVEQAKKSEKPYRVPLRRT